MRTESLVFLLCVGGGAMARFPAASDSWTWDDSDLQSRPVLIAHRGASGMFPEHTNTAYREAAAQGTDYIECDVVVTSDLQLLCTQVEGFGGNENTTRNMVHFQF